MTVVFMKLLSMSLSAGCVILAVLLTRFLLRRVGAPQWLSCALWGLVALRLLCPVSIESDLSLLPESVTSGTAVSEWADDYRGEIRIFHDAHENYQSAVEAGRVPIDAEEGRHYVVTAEDGVSEPPTVGNTLMPRLAVLWLIGAALMLLYALTSSLRLRKRVAASIETEPGVRICDAVHTPFVFGVLRPEIYLPSGLAGEERAVVLAHERAHLARHDHWWKPLGFVLLSVHWFNPLVWAAYVLFCRDLELACDEKVIRDWNMEEKKRYSEALLSLSMPRRQISACPLAFGEVGVKERVRQILHYKKPAFWIVAAAVLACVVLATCFLTDPHGNDGKILCGGVVYTQDGPPQETMPTGTRQTGRLLSEKDAPEDPAAAPYRGDFYYAKDLKSSCEGAPLFRENELRETLWLATSDGFIPFCRTPWPVLPEGKQRWFDENRTDTVLEVTLPEFEDRVFRCLGTQIHLVDPAGSRLLVARSQLTGAWFEDLNGDGCRELCAELGTSEEPEYHCIRVCDIANEKEYELDAASSERVLTEEKQVFDSGTEDLDEAIARAARQHFEGAFPPEGAVFVESHHILDAVELCGYPTEWKTEGRTQLTVYALVCCAVYDPEQSETPPTAVGGSCCPVKITFNVSRDGTYDPVRYWEPRDGSLSGSDLQQEFTEQALAALRRVSGAELSEKNARKAESLLF